MGKKIDLTESQFKALDWMLDNTIHTVEWLNMNGGTPKNMALSHFVELNETFRVLKEDWDRLAKYIVPSGKPGIVFELKGVGRA